ncbi:hypothetical protein JCM10213v2_008677 [Rhodosporidiobolus nylandii]
MPSLLDLPAELISHILELVFDTRYSLPSLYLYRGLLPIARAVVFRHTATTTFVRLTRLCELDGGDQLEVPVGINTLRAFLRQLPNLDELDIMGPATVAGVLKPTTTGPAIPSLGVLKLAYPHDWSDLQSQFDPRRFVPLGHYPHLDALELSWWLSLSGELVNNPATPNLLSFFDTIDSLTLLDTSPSSTHLAKLLEALPRPAKLTALTLGRVDPSALADGGHLDILHRFSNLASLELRCNSFTAADLPHLRSLPNLSRLVFGRETSISTSQLLDLAFGSDSLPSLRTLRLDLVYKPFPAFFHTSPLAYHGWTATFTFDGVGELLDVAEKQGVKLIGLAAGLVRREREYERRFGGKA